jgi:hypothetical protein
MLASPVAAMAQESITIYAKEADIWDSGLVLEPDEPLNIGGWMSGSAVIFWIEAPSDGIYELVLGYAKQDGGNDAEMAAVVEDFEPLLFSLAPAGTDWSACEEASAGEIFIPEGAPHSLWKRLIRRWMNTFATCAP